MKSACACCPRPATVLCSTRGLTEALCAAHAQARAVLENPKR